METPKTKMRWYNPGSWILRGSEEIYEAGRNAAVVTVVAATAYPRAVIQGVKESQARFAAASEYEKTITRWTNIGWVSLAVVFIGMFKLLPNGFTGFIVILIAGGFFFRGKRDLVRDQVVALVRMPEERQVNPLTLELAAVRLEETETIIRAWKALPKTERLGLSATILLRCLETLSRELPEDLPAADQAAEIPAEVAPVESTPAETDNSKDHA